MTVKLCHYCQMELVGDDEVIEEDVKTMCHNCGNAYRDGISAGLDQIINAPMDKETDEEMSFMCQQCQSYDECPCWTCPDRLETCSECFKTAKCDNKWLD
jgi:hypothetical protein